MTSPSPAQAPEQVFVLRGRGRRIQLFATGFVHPRSSWWPGLAFTPYEDVTHLQLGSRRLRIATRNGVFLLARREFADPHGAEALARALVERVARSPGGARRLAQMAAIEELFRRPGRLRATGAVTGVCVALALLERFLGPSLSHAGFFSASLVRAGEPWRVVTANFLHAFPLHLFANAIGLIGIGALVERPLGSARTALVLGLSGLGAMGAGALAHYGYTVGASGMVAGLAGAALYLEFRAPESLPAAWRIPRRLFLGALAADALLPLFVPMIAGAAHAGGFAAGAFAAALVTGPGLREDPIAPPLVVADVTLVTVLLAGFAAAAPIALRSPHALEAHAERLLAARERSPLVLNNAAWIVATAPGASPRALAAAIRLAEAAVELTQRRDPNVLDTLAEAEFRAGKVEEAVRTIEEAIALAPDQAYFRAQRRRFLGQLDRGPGPPAPAPPRRPRTPREGPGVRV